MNILWFSMRLFSDFPTKTTETSSPYFSLCAVYWFISGFSKPIEFLSEFPFKLILVWNKWAPCAFIYIVLNGGPKKNIASPSRSFWFPAISLENMNGFNDEVKRDSLPSLFLNGGFGISFPEWASHEWALKGTGPLKLARSNKPPSSWKCAVKCTA